MKKYIDPKLELITFSTEEVMFITVSGNVDMKVDDEEFDYDRSAFGM